MCCWYKGKSYENVTKFFPVKLINFITKMTMCRSIMILLLKKEMGSFAKKVK